MVLRCTSIGPRTFNEVSMTSCGPSPFVWNRLMDLPPLRFGGLELWMATAQRIDLDDVCPNFRVYTH